MKSNAIPRARGEAGFTRADLLALVLVTGLFAVIVLPALANNRTRSQRVICANNLRQIGVAMQQWGNDHNDLFPQEVSVAEGGTSVHPLAPNVWLHFSWLSNELCSAQVLFCPSDTGRPARDFSGDPNGGYVHPNFANRATSYFLTHSRGDQFAEMLSGDRNVGWHFPVSCGRFGTALNVEFGPFPVPF